MFCILIHFSSGGQIQVGNPYNLSVILCDYVPVAEYLPAFRSTCGNTIPICISPVASLTVLFADAFARLNSGVRFLGLVDLATHPSTHRAVPASRAALPSHTQERVTVPPRFTGFAALAPSGATSVCFAHAAILPSRCLLILPALTVAKWRPFIRESRSLRRRVDANDKSVLPALVTVLVMRVLVVAILFLLRLLS